MADFGAPNGGSGRLDAAPGSAPAPETVGDLCPGDVATATASCNAAGVFDQPWLDQCIIDVVVLAGAEAAGAGADAESEVPDESFFVDVPARSNLVGAGLSSVPDFGAGGTGNGILPPLISLPAGTGRTVRILDATGNVRFFPTETPACGPNGKVRPESSWETWGGLTGPRAATRCAVCAVFLTDYQRPPVAPPEYEDDVSDAFMAPEVEQIFCIGDGLTPEGELQSIIVPDDATRISLTLLARYSNEGDPPGWYGDNSGCHEVIVELSP